MNTGTYAQTHETILKNGKELFLKEGFERANLREICRLSGVTTGGFYRHFKDKADLFPHWWNPQFRDYKHSIPPPKNCASAYLKKAA